jgi:hypothetical protein
MKDLKHDLRNQLSILFCDNYKFFEMDKIDELDVKDFDWTNRFTEISKFEIHHESYGIEIVIWYKDSKGIPHRTFIYAEREGAK